MLSNIINNKLDSYKEPLVSIMCITFNHVNFIRETLNGFIIQKTNFPVEIIIHDDASQDGTQAIIKEYEALYPNIIKPIYQTENQYSKKIDIVKQYILPKIKGVYIAYCEGDDYWTDPLKLQKQIDFLELNKDYGLVYTDIKRINKRGDIIDENFLSNDKYFFCENFEDYLVYAPFRAPCTWVFRKSLFKEKGKKYIVGDLPLLLDIVAKSKIYFLKDTTANYRVLSNSASHFTNIDSYYKFSKGLYDVQLDYAKKYQVEKKIIDTIEDRFALEFYDYSVANYDLKQIEIANKLLKKKKDLSFKFKVIMFLSKFNLGRKIVRYGLIKRLGFTHK